MKMTMEATLVAAATGSAPPRWRRTSSPIRSDEAAVQTGRVGHLVHFDPVAAAQHIASEFERRTGIKVEMLRTGGQNVIRRFCRSGCRPA